MSERIEIEDGYYAKIDHDGDADQPYKDDNAVKIVVLHGRYIDPSKGICGTTPAEVTKWEKTNSKDWYTVPLWLYDHSGTSYKVGATNPFSCRWDSGQVGMIALNRSEWGDGKEPDEKMFEFAQAIAKEYTDWANGEIYSYTIYNENDEIIDSCSGFIGLDTVKTEIEIQAENLVSSLKQTM